MKQKLTMMELKESVDFWVKDINGKVDQVETIHKNFEENQNNIEHNYELIYELKDQIEDLKLEIKKLKLLHLLGMKKKMPINAK
tara:strand:- start:8457 stop:8708 length:252 start_codon:yes stop_codon:yes gene_type:complete